MNLGGAELIVLVVVAVALFGPTLIAFWLGYTLGKRKAAEEPPAPELEPELEPEPEPAPTAPVPTAPEPPTAPQEATDR